MATSKLIKPTNVTVSIPAFTDQPDQRVNSNCIDKSIDGINSLSDQIATLDSLKVLNTTITGTTSAYGNITTVQTSASVRVIGAMSAGYIVTPFVNSASDGAKWCFNIKTTTGDNVANTSVSLRYMYQVVT